MPKTTRKSEKEALAKARRKVRKTLKAKQASKTKWKKGLKIKKNTHPHRASSSKANEDNNFFKIRKNKITSYLKV